MITSKQLVTTHKKIDTILHLADIHIRLYKRHSEYVDVFNKLYDNLKSRDLSTSAIVVAGDIVHAKTDMSPEMIHVTSDFLKSLADLAPTIVIAGNHDLNLSNLNRLDALSPIIQNLQHKNLHYLKESGIYEMCGVQFGVHAITDTNENWPSASDMDTSRPRIALYHGPVNRAQTDAGYTVTNRMTVDAFAGYDMVMLGDIHKTQFLQEYGGPGVPEIFYCGSLIQQNHGETPDGHGYAVWDLLQNKVASYVEIKNEYGYHTIKLDSKKMPDISNLSNNIRLRILVGAVDNTLVKKLLSAIRKKYNVVECTINRLVDKKNKQVNTPTSALDNISDVTHQNTLITQHIQNHMSDTDPDVIVKVLEINSKLNGLIGDDELPKNISWRPIHLKFDNLFSYGEGNEINFSDMTGLYGVFSPNATGKTSAFDAMCFALYDKTPRAFKGSHIMNTRKDSFSCELTIEIENVQYIIERVGQRKKNGEVKVDVSFYKVDDDNKISLNGEDRRDTNATIRSYVGTYEDFVLTALSVQNQNSLFIDTGQSDRKDLLSQFIGLTIFDKLYNLASDEIKEVVGALKNFKNDDFTQRLADVQKKIETETSICTSIESDIKQLTQDVDSYEIQIKQLYEQKIPEIVEIDVQAIQEELDETEIRIVERTKLMDELREEQTKVQQEFNKLSADLSKTKIEKLKDEYDQYMAAKNAAENLKSQIKLLRIDANNKLEKLQKLQEHKYDPNCEFCINNVFVKDAISTRGQYDTVLSKIDILDNKLNGSEEYLKAREHAEVNYSTALVSHETMRKLSETLNNMNMNISHKENQNNLDNTRISYLYTMIDQFNRNNQAIETNKQIQTKIDQLDDIRDKFLKNIDLFRNNLRQHDRELTVLNTKKDEMMVMLKSAKELEITYEAYEVYLNTVGRDGLPYELISEIIPTLETEVNNILSQMVDFTVSMEVDGKNINGKILYDDHRTWPLELASGMEKFITGLAIRVALMSVSNLPKSNFLVIDEGLGVLDSDNLASMSMLFGILKNQFDFIILISHLDVVRDIADSLIDIRRDDGYSYITVK